MRMGRKALARLVVGEEVFVVFARGESLGAGFGCEDDTECDFGEISVSGG